VVLNAINAVIRLSPADAAVRLAPLLDSSNRRAAICAAAFLADAEQTK
jgi:hypothetical protein